MNHSFHSAHWKRYMNKPLISVVSGGILFFYPQHSFATPTEGTVANGSATIQQNGLATVINQGSSRAVIDWRGFDISNDEKVQFIQASSSAIALNRITGGNPTTILGQLAANGRVFISNPNGVVFGAGSRVDVAGLLATTLSINADEFMNGKTLFTQSLEHSPSFVVNQGEIHVADNGFCFLVAGGVQNSGTIIGQLGKVVLASANNLTLDFNGDGLVTYTVSGKVLQSIIGPDGKPFDAAVSNSGTITTPGGEIVMVGNGAKDAFASVVNNSGVIEATSLNVKNGSVTLNAGEGDAVVTGSINVSGTSAGQVGGKVEVLGNRVGLFGNAAIDASGSAGGGTVLVGGDLHGQGGVPTASQTVVSSGATIKANAIDAGDGGKVVVWADNSTSFNGTIEARGGTAGGNGGFVETSGKQTLAFNGNVDTRAPQGLTGTLLLDPTDITISTAVDTGTMTNTSYTFSDIVAISSNLKTTTLVTALNSSSVIVDTNLGALGGAGTITVSDAISWSSANSLTLKAKSTLTTNATITNNSTGALNFYADGAVNVNAAISLTGGAFKVADYAGTGRASSFTNGSGSISTGGGQVNIDTSGGITVGTINANAGAVNLTSNSGAITSSTSSITAGALTLSGTSIGISGTKINTTVSSIDATATSGGIYLTEANGLSLIKAKSYDGDVTISYNDGNARTLSFTSDTLNTTGTASNSTAINFEHSDGGIAIGLVDAGAAAVSLTATGGNITDAGTHTGADIVGGTITLTTTGSYTIGTASTALQLNATTLIATTNGGNLYVNDTLDGVAVGAINLTNAGSVYLTATGYASTGEATGAVVTSGRANITAGADCMITAGAVTLTTAGKKGGAIGATGATTDDTITPISTTVEGLTASTNHGGIYITESTGLIINSVIARESMNFGTLDGIAPTANPSTGNVELLGGNNVTQAGTFDVSIAAAGNILLGVVTAPDAATITTGIGTIIDNNDVQIFDSLGVYVSTRAVNNITAQTVDLQTTGDIGLSSDAIETLVETTKAIATSGNVYFSLGNMGYLQSIIAGPDKDVSVTESSGSLSLGTITASSGTLANVTIDNSSNGSGALTDANGTDTNITASNLVMLGKTGIGLSGDPIRTAVGTLDVTALNSTSGIYISNSSALSSIDATTNSGAVTINNTSTGTLGFSSGLLTASGITTLTFENTGGGLELGAINTSNDGVVTLTALGAITDDGNNTTSLIANTATLVAGTSIGTSASLYELDTTVNTLNATASVGGVYASNSKALTLTASATGSNKDIVVGVTGSTSNLTLMSVLATGLVDLTATGAIIDGNDTALIAAHDLVAAIPATYPNNITASSLKLSGTSIGTSGDAIETAVSTMTSLSATTGGMYIDNTAANLALIYAKNTIAGNDITITSSGNIALNNATNAITALGGAVRLSATGAITDGNTSSNIEASSLTLSGTSIGEDGDAIDTKVSTMTSLSATAGGIYIANTAENLTLTAATAIGSGADIRIINSGNIALGTITAAGNDATLTATAGQITKVNGSTRNVTAKSLDITASAGITSSLVLAVDELMADGGTGNNVSLTNLNPLAISEDTLEKDGTGTLTFVAPSITILDFMSDDDTATITSGRSLVLRTTAGDIVFLDTNDIIQTSGTGTITIEAGTTDNSGAVAIIGDLKTANQAISVSADRHVTIGRLDAGTANVTVAATHGIILDGNNDELNIIAGTATLSGSTPEQNVADKWYSTAVSYYVAAVTLVTSDETLTSTWQANSDIMELAKVYANNAVTTATSDLSAKNAIKYSADAKVAPLNTASIALGATATGLDIGLTIAETIAAAAGAIPFTGDCGAGIAADILKIAKHAVDISKLVVDIKLGIATGEATTAEINVAKANAQLYASQQDLTQATFTASASAESLALATAATAKAIIARSAAEQVKIQAIAADNYTGNVYSANAIGTPILSLGIQVPGRVDITANNSNVYLAATGNVTLGTVTAGSPPRVGSQPPTIIGDSIVSVAGTGNITVEGTVSAGTKVRLDAATAIMGTTNGLVSAPNFVATATNGIGATTVLNTHVDNFAATGGTGGVNISNDQALKITTVDGVIGVTATGGTSAITTTNAGTLTVDKSVTSTASNGNLVLNAASDLTINDIISANGSGNILLQSTGTGSITTYADIISGTGNISVLAAKNVDFKENADIRTTTGTIDVVAGSTGSITMDPTSLFTTTGHISLLAATDVNIGEISTVGNVSIKATGGSIVDTDTDVNDTNVNITTSGLRLSAGKLIGTSVNHVETTVANLTTDSGSTGAATDNSTFITETDDVTVSNVTVQVNRVSTAGVAVLQDAVIQEDLVTEGTGGDLVLVTTNGLITINGGTATSTTGISATGNILLSANENPAGVWTEGSATNADITLNASVTSTTGNISIIGKDNITQNANGDITTSESTKTIDLLADNAITMVDGAVTQSNNGNIRYEATAGNITLGELNAGTTGDVALIATAGSILDLSTDNSNSGLDITANDLILTAGTAIGESTNHIETSIDYLSTKSSNGSTFITETDGVTVNAPTAIALNLTVNRVDSLGGTATGGTSVTQEDLTTTGTNSDLVLVATNGVITVNGGATATAADGISATGDILLNALDTTEATNADITLNASVTSTTGNISIIGKDNITQNANGDITTSESTKTIDLLADNAITMVDGAVTQSNNSNIRYEATAGDITLGELNAGTGNVALTATAGSILDLTTDTSAVDITASGLRLWAGTGIGVLGASSNAIETTVTTLSARAAGGGINILESDGVMVDDVAAVTVQRVGSDAVLTSATDAKQSDLATTSGGGNIVLRTSDGNITLNDGTADVDNTAISANGSGNILLQAQGTNGSITANANADVMSGNGHITLLAAKEITFGSDVPDALTRADISTGGGTIDLEAGTGSITMSTTSNTTSSSGDIRMLAATDVNIGGQISTAGSVSITATAGSILDNDNENTTVDIVANGLRLWAGTGIGEIGNPIETSVTTVSARTTDGSINIVESDSLSVGDTSATAYVVQADGTATATTDTQSNITTTTGAVNLVAGGNIGLGRIVSTSGAVNVTATDGAIIVNTSPADGNIVTTGLMTLEAKNGIGSASSALKIDASVLNAQSDGGNIYLNDIAGGVTLGLITTGGTTSGEVSLTATNGSITESGDDAGAEIIGNTINLVVTGAGSTIGTAANALEIDTAVLNAQSDGGNMYLNDIAGGVALGLVTTGGTTLGEVNLTATDGSITESGNDAGADVVGNTLNLVVTGAGSIGTAGNTLEIDAAVLNAQSAGGGIYLHDIAGGVAIGLIDAGGTGGGDVTLVATDGSITESGSDSAADIVGKSVNVVINGTPGSALGTLRNMLEISSPNVAIDNIDGNTYIDLNNGSGTGYGDQSLGMTYNSENLPEVIVYGNRVQGGDRIDELLGAQSEITSYQLSTGVPVTPRNLILVSAERLASGTLTLNNNVIY